MGLFVWFADFNANLALRPTVMDEKKGQAGVRIRVGRLISRLKPEITSGLDEKVESGASMSTG
jgi:hypothetical protein